MNRNTRTVLIILVICLYFFYISIMFMSNAPLRKSFSVGTFQFVGVIAIGGYVISQLNKNKSSDKKPEEDKKEDD